MGWAAIGRPCSTRLRIRRKPMQARKISVPDERCSPLQGAADKCRGGHWPSAEFVILNERSKSKKLRIVDLL